MRGSNSRAQPGLQGEVVPGQPSHVSVNPDQPWPGEAWEGLAGPPLPGGGRHQAARRPGVGMGLGQGEAASQWPGRMRIPGYPGSAESALRQTPGFRGHPSTI